MGNLTLDIFAKDEALKAKGFIEIDTEEGVQNLPVSVIQNGAHPRITIVGAQHSCEYAGSDALIKLIKDFDEIDPEKVNGSIVMIPVANVPGYPIRTNCVSQFDGSNLNRSYPGDPQGTTCERIANVIWSIAKTGDYVIDLHGGDIAEHIIKYSEQHLVDDEEITATSLALASCFDLDTVLFSIAGNDYAYPDFRSLYGLAQTSGIPAALVEAGSVGISDADSVEYFYEGLKNVFRRFGFIEIPQDDKWKLEKRPLNVTMGVSCIERPYDGRLVKYVTAGDMVEKGQLMGEVTDYLGNVIDTIKSPRTGVVSLALSTNGKNGDDLLFMVLDLEQAVKIEA